MNLYTFLDHDQNIIETVRASSKFEALKNLSDIAKTLLIDYSIEGA